MTLAKTSDASNMTQLNSTQLYLFQTEKQTENTMRNGWMEQD